MSYLGVTCMGLLGPNVLFGCDLHGTAWTECLNLGVTCMGLLGLNVLLGCDLHGTDWTECLTWV